jgi:hypothetical protein
VTDATPDAAWLDALFQMAGDDWRNWRAAECRVELLRRGGNNRIWKISHAEQACVVKAYYRHPSDPRDRLGAEFSFLRHIWAKGVRQVPQPLAADRGRGVALYSFVEGQTVPEGADISRSDVDAAACFLRDINVDRGSPSALALPAASEACFSEADHLALMHQRVRRLDSASPVPEVKADTDDLVQRIGALARQVDVSLRSISKQAVEASTTALASSSRCLSPSDFGFHNALRRPDGQWAFLDFEYAGWDDPAKTVADFFAHPGFRVDRDHARPFWARFSEVFDTGDRAALKARVQRLAPVFRLKWACIVLNELLADAARRREFAGNLSPSTLAERQRTQLSKSNSLLDTLFEPLNL